MPLLRYNPEQLRYVASERRWVYELVLDFVVLHKEDTSIAGKKEEVFKLLEAHGTTAKGAFSRRAKRLDKLCLFPQFTQLSVHETSTSFESQERPVL
jgi:hypothetical protein